MKKTVAILLLTVHLFNLAGYYVFFHLLIQKSDTQIVQSLNTNNYSEKDLVEVKVPLSLPYMTNTKDFERIDGEIEFNGTHYNYVKRKLSNDTLYILCLANVDKTKLYNERTKYSCSLNDLPINKKTSDSNIKKITAANEYNYINSHYFLEKPVASVRPFDGFPAVILLSTYLSSPGQPPEPVC